MDKMKMQSPDGVVENLERMALLFPGCITETRDTDGTVKRTVDFDLLRQELSADLVEGPVERYQLNWPGKRQAIAAANAPINKTLRPCREESVDFDTTGNLYIEADCLDAMKLMQESYLGKIKMITIDPPYNTGKDFIYKDNFTADKDAYEEASGQRDEEGGRLIANLESNGRYHSDWLSMMLPRLRLARNLLRDDGVIFINIDDNEVHNLRKLCDEVFGADNFVGNIAWESKTKSQNTTTSYNKLQPRVEHILLYTRASCRRFNLKQIGEKSYPEKDEHGIFRYAKIEVMASGGVRGRETMIFPIKDVSPPPGKQWKIGSDTAKMYEARGDLLLIDGIPSLKIRPEDERSEVAEPFWGLINKDMGTAESAKKELTETLGDPPHGFETVKPLAVICKLIFHACSRADLVLDFFSGSATTAHAVMQLNAEDGGNRKFIMVQLPEVCDEKSEAFKAGFKNICEIGKERIRRAGKKIKAENATTAPELDIGFRVLKLDSSNMRDVYYTPDKLKQDAVELFTAHIKEDRKAEDLLFQVLLDWGIPLSARIEQKKLGGKSVYLVNETDILACFEQGITEEAVKQFATLKPLRAVFRDDAFDDCLKINVEQLFKVLSPDTEVKAI